MKPAPVNTTNDTDFPLKCTKCGHEWGMPIVMGSSLDTFVACIGKKPVCPKCGKRGNNVVVHPGPWKRTHIKTGATP